MTTQEYRQWKGLTLTQFAQLCGYSNAYISMIESGARQCSRNAAMRIRTATNGHVDFSDLFEVA